MRPSIDTRWIEYFQNKGFSQVKGISVGMEGAVYSLVPNEIVAKVWLNKKIVELQKLQSFYNKLSSYSTAIKTPQIVDVLLVDDTPISLERFLWGRPLENYLVEDADHADSKGVDAVVKVLEFLCSVPDETEFRTLSVLDEPTPAWDGFSKWSDVINNLISLRYAKFGSLLQSDIPNLTDILNAASNFLITRNNVKMSLIHGDLCGPNVMLNDKLEPISVFDFGFLSMAGDPAFDAGVTSSLFNMYGASAEIIDKEVTSVFADRLGYDKRILLAYKAIYALITSNAYGVDKTDGHYQWCVRMLRRKDVLSSLNIY